MNRKQSVADFFNEYRKKLDTLFDLVDKETLTHVVGIIIETFKNGKTLYIAGNGGSAATASHMNVDFQFFIRRFTKFRPKVCSLTDNIPLITAICNDHSYDDIFTEQMNGKFEKGDTIICISSTGNSMNIIKAAEYANAKGGTSIAFVGASGGKLKDTATVSLFTPNPKGEYGTVEDLHMFYIHFLINYIVKDEEFLKLQPNEN